MSEQTDNLVKRKENFTRTTKKPSRFGNRGNLECANIGSETEEEPFSASSSDEYKPPSPKKQKVIYTATKSNRNLITKNVAQGKTFRKGIKNHFQKMSDDKDTLETSKISEHNFDDQCDKLLNQSNGERIENQKTATAQNDKALDPEPASTHNYRDLLHYVSTIDEKLNILIKVVGNLNNLPKIDEKLNNLLSRVSVMESSLIGRLANLSHPMKPNVVNNETEKLDVFMKSNCLPTKKIEELDKFDANLKEETFYTISVSKIWLWFCKESFNFVLNSWLQPYSVITYLGRQKLPLEKMLTQQ